MKWPATLALLGALAIPAPASELREVRPAIVRLCFFDCNGDGRVKINEVQLIANIFLGVNVVSRCPPLEAYLEAYYKDGHIAIADVQAAANAFLYGCSSGLSRATIPEQRSPSFG